MSEAQTSEALPAELSHEQRASALFAQLIMQQANMALMLLGKVPHPDSGQVVKDIEAARLFIDQLEMLEAKTKGNLTKEEAGLLKQSLMSLHLAFVEAVDSPPQPQTSAQPPAAEPPKTAPEEEHQKKFSKKY
jgi:hypothetical protein